MAGAGADAAGQLIYYTRLSVRTSELLLVKIVAGTVVATWILSLATFFLECRPVELYWQVLPAAPECAASFLLVGWYLVVG